MQAVADDARLLGHAGPRLHADAGGRVHLDRRRGAQLQAVEQLLAGLAAGTCDIPVVKLDEGDIEARADLRSGAHRGTEAGPGGLGAVDGHDEGLAAPIGIVLVDVGTAGQDVIVDGQRGQVAGTHAEIGHARRVVLDVVVGELAAGAARPRDGHRAGVGEGLPRHRRGREVERLVRAAVAVAADAVATGRLLIDHAGGQIGDGADLVVDDGRVGDGGSHHPTTVLAQQRDEAVELLPRQPCPGCQIDHSEAPSLLLLARRCGSSARLLGYQGSRCSEP